MIIAKEDFLWFKQGQVIPKEDYRENWSKHVILGDGEKVVSEPVVEPKKKLKIDEKGNDPSIFDLNRDGKVDMDDVKMAAKTLRTLGSRFKNKTRSKKK